MTEAVPQVEQSVLAGSDELSLARSGRQRVDLLHVANHHLVEAKLEVAGEDGVSGGAEQELGARALRDGPD